MHYAYRFRLKPTPQQRELLDYHRNTCRQLYNHALREFNKIPDTVVRDSLPPRLVKKRFSMPLPTKDVARSRK
jgi:hypothetical protein